MNQQYRPGGFSLLPPVVKNLLIINGLMFLGLITFKQVFNIDLNDHLGLYFMGSEKFRPYQYVTYMFMHGGLGHIFFNMFALWMFGKVLENLWGPKRFLIYYLVTGIGAGFFHFLVNYIQFVSLKNSIPAESLQIVMEKGYEIWSQSKNFTHPQMGELNEILNIPTVGASGAIFGVLLAFGMLFPNSVLYLYFAIPVKAKYFVIFYGLLELYMGFASRPGDNVAHFAHLGGMIFGFILIKYWKNKGTLY